MKKEILIRTKNLVKKYKNNIALDNINLNIEKGSIYAFIGRNGAGKTTLLRILTGLAFKSSGELELFGDRDQKDIQYQRRRIGSLIEGPTLHMSMTAYQNLETQRICRGIPNENYIEDILNLVGLKNVEKKKVKDFSLGMRQRLGIAMALLNNPELLILDEPTNGLDPMGIVEMRKLLKKLNREKNMTIIISSHILSELYELGTNYIIIDNGKILENITLDELNERCRKHICIKVNDVPKALTVLENKLKTNNYKVMEDQTIKLYDHLDSIERVSALFSQEGLILSQLSLAEESLEEYFSDLVGGKSND